MAWHLNHTHDSQLGPIAWGKAGDGPPLVLAHGWPWSSYSWHRVIPTLATYFTVYWYDMPGFGKSTKALAHPTGLDAQAVVFAEMLSVWQLDKPSVWAHDFGGAICLRAQLLHDARYNRTLLMNIVMMRPWGSAFFDHVGRHIEAFLGLPPHIHAAVVKAYIDGALVKPLDEQDRDVLEAPWRDEEGQRAFYRQFAQADEALTAEIEHKLNEISRPIQVIWGAEDPWIPLDRGKALAKAIGCDVHPMQGLGHLPQLEDPKAVLDTALPYLMAEAA